MVLDLIMFQHPDDDIIIPSYLEGFNLVWSGDCFWLEDELTGEGSRPTMAEIAPDLSSLIEEIDFLITQVREATAVAEEFVAAFKEFP